MKKHQRLNGLVAASFTPMDEAGNLKLETITAYADWLAKAGLTGIFVNGTTGESLSLTTEERKLVLGKWIEAVDGRYKVIAHVGSNSIKEAEELASHAQSIGADAIAAMAPCFFKPSTVSDLLTFFKPVAGAASKLPFYYYNMPSMTGVSLSVVQFLREGSRLIPNLAGVKFTHNNLMELGECIALKQGEFEILNGYDETLIAGLSFGAEGGVGSTYNYIPAIYQELIKDFQAGDMEKARTLQLKAIEVVEIIIKYGGGVRGGKAIMNLIGIDCGPCRLPLSPFKEEEYVLLKDDLKRIGFFK